MQSNGMRCQAALWESTEPFSDMEAAEIHHLTVGPMFLMQIIKKKKRKGFETMLNGFRPLLENM